MKKIFLAFTFCFSIFSAFAQQNNELADFNAFTQANSSSAHEAYKNNNYKLAATTLNRWFGHYDQLSPDVKKKVTGYAPGMYYNMACYTALAGQRAEALALFEKAVSLGYSDYSNTLADSDLVSLHNKGKFKTALIKMRERSDYGYMLQNSGAYNHKNTVNAVFTYQPASAPELVALKNQFNLDSIAGNGDEISKFKNLLYFVHNAVKHDGNSNNPPLRNAADLIAVCKKENRGVNCRMMATILRDVYQAEGFNTRIVTCMPKDTADNDCHVITVVWSKMLNKWVWMDPTFNAYVTDDKGNLLNIQEVRERLINGGALVVNDDANWNNKQKETKVQYLGYYMSKNLYWLKCSVKSEWNIETLEPGKALIEYINLNPENFDAYHQLKKVRQNSIEYATNNPDYFWQKPEGQ